MTTRVVGRVVHAEREVQWQYDEAKRMWVEYTTPNLDELEQIGRVVRAIDRERLGLQEAVKHARARGFSWSRIAAILDVPEREAQEQFAAIDVELANQGEPLPADSQPKAQAAAAVPAAKRQSKQAATEEFDFSALNSMSTDELVQKAKGLSADGRLHDHYLSRLRQAIVVTLYKRDISQPQIARIINKSPQRVSQIIGAYYSRIEQAWKEEQQARGKEV